MPKGISIAIDGPVASGKGTIAQVLKNKLNGFFLNTGAMYRAVALFCLENKVKFKNETAIEQILPDLDIKLLGEKVILNDSEISEKISNPEISEISSIIAIYPTVRKELVRRQQEIANALLNKGKVVIAEGRDTGTRVLPRADLKIFLTADLKVRAKRRLLQYENKGIRENIKSVIEETLIRDERDMGREFDPLPRNPLSFGYIILDNSNQTEEETIDFILKELKRKSLIK